MSQWVRRGIKTGIKTTRYPATEETAAGISPGLPLGGTYSEEQASLLVDCCPTSAISRVGRSVIVDYRRCVHCFRCGRLSTPLVWKQGYEWAATTAGNKDLDRKLGDEFKRSVNIIVVDAGDCGACLNEVKQLNNPYYNMHRLGFFITPTPRLADILIVVGPGTEQMRFPLEKTYNAMATPKVVIAVGTCALSGGVFSPSFASSAGVTDILPVDVEVPGSPPPPLAILHGLLVAVGRKTSATLTSPTEVTGGETR